MGHLWVLLPIVGITVRAGRDITDNSFLWHVRAGTVQLDAGEVLRHDPFSFTFGDEPWRTQSWLADLLYGWFERTVGGLQWVPVLTGLIGAATFIVLAVVLQRRRPGPLPTAAVLALLMWLGYAALVPRPVVMSYLMLALVILALQNPQRRGWSLPLLMWVWAAIHGSFVMGLGLIGLEAVRSRRWRILAPHLVASTLMVTLTAHGWGVWQTLWQFMRSREGLEHIGEWDAPILFGKANWPLLVLIGLVAAGLAVRRLQWRDLIVIVPFAAFALTTQRSVFPGAMVLAVFAVSALPEAKLGRRRAGDLIPGVAAGALVALSIFVLARPVALDATRFPLAASSQLAAGPVFHEDATGGYLIYAQGPRRQVFIDDRAELYGGFIGTMVAALDGEGWEELFTRFEIEQALLRVDHPLADELAAAGWPEVYRDAEFLLYLTPHA